MIFAFLLLPCYFPLGFTNTESESASEATSCTSADTMDESDSSMEREGTTTCSPPFIRAGRLRRRKAPERDFKETKKTKLNGSAAKRFFQKIKQKLTARKLRRRLKKTEVAPLLIEESGSGSDSGTATVDADRKEKKKSKRTKSAKNSKEKKLDPFSVLDVKPLLDEGDESDDESSDASEGVGQGEEFEEIDLDGDISQVQTRRNKWPTKESMEIEEVVSDKKRRQIEARRLRRQKKKVPLIIPSTPLFLWPSVQGGSISTCLIPGHSFAVLDSSTSNNTPNAFHQNLLLFISVANFYP